MTPRSFNLACIGILVPSVVMAMGLMGALLGTGGAALSNVEGGAPLGLLAEVLRPGSMISLLGSLALAVMAVLLLLRLGDPKGEDQV